MKIAILEKAFPSALLLVLLWTAWRLAVLNHTGMPVPVVADEFSYLLQADTFAHGHLANPSPPLGGFFESYHELVRPVYASKYPPGQAMFLALGQKAFGSPFYGVLISNVVMLFITCLMLFAWVPPAAAWAASGMLALCMRPAMYWTNSYWGGSVAATGGALVLLGIGIYRNTQKLYAGAIFAVGALLLVWSRPYEGGVFTLAILAVFARELWQKRRVGVLAFALPVLIAGIAWTCYDNEVITHHLFRLPYMEHARQYDVAPAFWFLSRRPQPLYSHARLAAFHGDKGEGDIFYRAAQPWYIGFGRGLFYSMKSTAAYLGPATLLTLLVPLAWSDPVYRRMAIVGCIFLFALSAEIFHFPHYTAPVWAALLVMIALWMREAWGWKIRGLSIGKALCLLVVTYPLATAELARLHLIPDHQTKPDWAYRRASLIQQLSALNRPQLVIVRYPTPAWGIDEEWVYNSANIDRQAVIFAHDLGPQEDRTLLAYYPGRSTWLLTFDPTNGLEHLQPFPGNSSQ